MITQGYSKLYQTKYLRLKINDTSEVKNWIESIIPEISTADPESKMTRVCHLAFAYEGLVALGISDENVDGFPVSFREGMNTGNRNRLLGDHGPNAPEKWLWGSNNAEHLLVILHAADETEIASYSDDFKGRLKGVEVVGETSGYLREDNKEPFGFHDGISQPVIKGSGQAGPVNDIIETGEFLLGYKNEHGLYPDSPKLKKQIGDTSLLTSDPAGSGFKDLGFNGTFMVFRQIQQHVDAFWDAMEKHTLDENGQPNEKAKIRLAAKCVGRWPSGASLVNFPDEDPGGSYDNDDFSYAENDPHGFKCPYGSHLRRNNPRDAHRDYNKEQSLKISKRHRILRRGRTYETAINGQHEIGLLFICFNANTELQYEFIQHTWANNAQDSRYNNDLDIIIGVPDQGKPDTADVKFTIQNNPVDEYHVGWDRFVTIRGGSYYFFPSISAIKYLTTV